MSGSDPNLIARLVADGDAAERRDELNAAIKAWERADRLRPGDVQILLRLGLAHRRLEHGPEAHDLFLRAETAAPKDPWPKIRLAELYSATEHLPRAAGKIDEALALDPDNAFAALVGARVELMMGADAAAVRRLADARRRFPERGDVAYRLGSILIDLGCPRLALPHLEDARRLGDHGIDPREFDMVEGAGRLGVGETKAGWTLFQTKNDWIAQSAKIEAPGVARWWRVGDPFPTGRVLLCPNEGIGDDILFGHLVRSFSDAVTSKSGSVTLACDQRLTGLMSRSFPMIDISNYVDRRAHRSTVRKLKDEDARFDVGVTPINVPLLLDPSVRGDVSPAYLKAAPARVEDMVARLDANGASDVPRIGVTWTSSLNRGERARHFPALKALMELSALKPARFVSIQYGDTDADIAALGEAGLTIERIDGLDLRNDLEGLAALTAGLDAVVGVANASSAIAAAVGTPAYLVMREGHWSLLGAKDYPWTPHVRPVILDEAGHPQAWAQAVKRIRGEIVPLSP